jgi:hypothetical protein
MNESAGLEKEEAGLIAEPTNRLDDLWQASEGIFTSRSQSCAGLTSSTVARWEPARQSQKLHEELLARRFGSRPIG